MRRPGAIFVILAACAGPVSSQDDPPKKPNPVPIKITSSVLTTAKFDAIKKGMTVADLTAAVGPVTRFSTPGDPTIRNAETQLEWEDRTSVRVIFKDGKVTGCDGKVSPTLTFERVTQENVLKVAVGAAEKDVIELFGGGYSERTEKDGVRVLQWTAVSFIRVQLYQGKSGTAKSAGTTNVLFE